MRRIGLVLLLAGVAKLAASAPTSPATPHATSGSPPPAQALNLSTRMRVQTGENVGIGGLIITGTAPKHLLFRAIGPSLSQFGVPDVLADPVLELHGPGSFATITNNNWRDDPAQAALILATGIPPTDDLESAIDATLDPGSYTAIVKGNNNTSGVALIEIYDLNPTADSKLANISTRALVSTNDNIVIGGFILGGHSGDDTIVVRGIGPSLAKGGIVGALEDPAVELRDSNGALLMMNGDWRDNIYQAALLTAIGLAPHHPFESAMVITLPPGPYTTLLAADAYELTGVALVEIYDIGPGGALPPPTPTPTPCAGTVLTDFDEVTAPVLPAGWVATNNGGDPTMWVTSTVDPDTAPNDAFLPDQDGISDKFLDSPAILITSPFAQLSFRHNVNMEYYLFPEPSFWDGSVLEVSSPNINGGAFTDITDPAVGGVFLIGGYNGVIVNGGNPLTNRMAWSGNSLGYFLTIVNLGPNLNGQTITLRFRMATDESIAAPGWRIDTISLGTCPAPSPTPTPTASPTPTATPSPTATPAPTPTPSPTPGPTATATPSASPTPDTCPWSFGAPLPAAGLVAGVGSYFPANERFYVMGGRSADTAGSEFPHPFEYNPSANAWVIKTATYPDDNVSDMACGVLVVSGTPQIYCVGGSATGSAIATARVFSYDPMTDAITSLNSADNWPGNAGGNILPGGFAVAENKLYIIGGFQLNTAMTAQTWQFDPTQSPGSRWTQKSDYPVARGYVPAAGIGGVIYTAGGTATNDGSTLSDTTDSFKYDTVTNSWTAIASIPRATGETRALHLGGNMWVLGGGRTAPNPSNEVEFYIPLANVWSVASHFLTARRSFAADTGDGSVRIWLVGGYDANNLILNTTERFGSVSCATPTPAPP